MTPGHLLFLAGVLLVIGFILSAAEAAFTSLSPRQIRNLEKTHAGKLRLWMIHEERMLATMLIGANMATAGMGSLAAILSEMHLAGLHHSRLTTGMITIGSGLLTLFVGAILPKALARQNPEKWALHLGRLVSLFAKLLNPLTKPLVKTLERLGGPRSLRRGDTKPLVAWELKEILAHSSLHHKSKKILTNLIQFASLPVRLVMTPREQIFSINVDHPLETIYEALGRSPYTRIPVIRGSLDNIIGIVYSKDLLLAWRTKTLVLLEDLLRPVHYVRLDTPLAECLRVFRTGQQHISLIKDHLGKTRGLVTLEDALEEIVGPIPTEPDL